jgi:sugar O-acyltransferase (sialic acid O-acetyltransferase NeuD family)
MKELIIVGAGGFGREVKCLIETINRSADKPQFSILGFVDDDASKENELHGLPLLGPSEYISTISKDVGLVLAIGNPKIKRQLFSRFREHSFPNIVHPNVSLDNFGIQIGKGCIICEGTILTCDIEIGDFCILNLACTIGHDSKVGSYSSIMPAVNISGEVIIASGVYIGTGAKIINQVSIGEESIIGAGAVVSKSIPAYCTAVGIPAKPIKFSKENE